MEKDHGAVFHCNLAVDFVADAWFDAVRLRHSQRIAQLPVKQAFLTEASVVVQKFAHFLGGSVKRTSEPKPH